MEPLLPHGDPDAGLPAADVGPGAEPADGFGVEGEEPDAPEVDDTVGPASG